MYVAMIGDIIGSKQLENRRQVQDTLSLILESLNQEYEEKLASKITITLGDEFQGLFFDGSVVLEVIDKIKFQIYPIELRFGIGMGSILTDIQPEISIGADGPAYWYAREAINKVHEENDYQLSRVLIEFGESSAEFNLVNESLKLCDYIESRWRESQRSLMTASVLIYGHSLDVLQRDLAAKLGISNQAVNQRIQSTGYYPYLRTKRTITATILEKWGRE